MGYLNACSFSYDNVSSELYDLGIGWTDSEDELDSGLEREVIKGDVNLIRHRANQYGAKYSSTIKLEFIIFHKDGSDFTYEESRAINRWLAPTTYKPLRFDNDDTDNVIYMAICTSIRDCVYNSFNGKRLSFDCDSPFSYTPLNVFTFDATSGEKTKLIYNISDDGIFYPDIEIICNGDFADTVTLTNLTDNEESMVFDFSKVEQTEGTEKKSLTISTQYMSVMDGNGKIIPMYQLGWTIELNPDEAIQSRQTYWLRLIEGSNKIKVEGTCKLKLKCQFPRKAGVV